MVIPLIPLCFFPLMKWVKCEKKILIRNILIVLVVFFILLSGIIALFQIQNTNMLLLLVGAYFYWFYRKEVALPFFKTLFWFCTVCLLGAFSLLISLMIDLYIHPSIDSFTTTPNIIFVQTVFLILSDIFLYYPSKKYMGWIMGNFHVEKIWNFIFLFPLLFFLLTVFLIPYNYTYRTFGIFQGIYFTIILAFLLLIILIYIMFYRIASGFIKNQQLERRNHFYSIQTQQYQQLQNHMLQTSRMRHDFRHQLTVIIQLLNNKKYEEMNSFLRSYVSSISPEIKYYSYSAAVNAILSYYEVLCTENNIRIDFRITLPEVLSICDMDFCVLLGNLLENAVYGCEGTLNPCITLKIAQTAPHVLVLKIKNPYKGGIREKDGSFLSSRHDDLGIGIDSVKMLVDKYSGKIEITYDEHFFIVRVLLKL